MGAPRFFSDHFVWNHSVLPASILEMRSMTLLSALYKEEIGRERKTSQLARNAGTERFILLLYKQYCSMVGFWKMWTYFVDSTDLNVFLSY